MENLGIKDVVVVDRRVVYDGFVSLVEYTLEYPSYDGITKIGPVVRVVMEKKSDPVAVLPYSMKAGKVALKRELRAGLVARNQDPWNLELFAGMSDGLDLEEAVLKEVQEEASQVVSQDALKKIFSYTPSNGACSEMTHLYAIEVENIDDWKGIHGAKKESEDILVEQISFDEAFTMLQKREIKDAATIIALQWLWMEVTSSGYFKS